MGTLFLRLLLDMGRYFAWSSKPLEGLAICTAKAVPSFRFRRYFSTLSIGPAPGIELATSCSADKRSTD